MQRVHFLPPKHASRCFSNEFSQHHWWESFDGDSFVSQSRFDAYAPPATTPLYQSDMWKIQGMEIAKIIPALGEMLC